jgi:hypothetical protein
VGAGGGRPAIARAKRNGPAGAGSTRSALDEPLTRYIGNTDGEGISLREACRENARSSEVWPEGTVVSVTAVGEAECAGWSYVESGQESSWVRDEYLVEERPSVAVPPPGAPNADAIAQLDQWYGDVLDLSDRLDVILDDVDAGTSTRDDAAVLLYELQRAASDYAGQIANAGSLEDFSPACELGRLWMADAAAWLSEEAGWWGLINEQWPYANNFDDQDEANANYYDSMTEAINSAYACAAG